MPLPDRYTVLLLILACVACSDEGTPLHEGDTGSSGGEDTPLTTIGMTAATDDDDDADDDTTDGDDDDDDDTTDGDDDDDDATTTGDTTTGGGTETGTPDDVPPTIELVAPRDGRMTPVRRVRVIGTVADDVGVTSLVHESPDGDVDIDVEPDGSFDAWLDLTPGSNAVTLRAEDEAGNAGDVTVDVYYGHRFSVGNSQSGFIREGTLFTWGRNELGQLGNGTQEGSAWGDDPATADLPVRYEIEVEGLLSLWTRQTYMIALRDDGQVMTWGSNASGQLGYEAETDCGSGGTSPCRRTPTDVPGVAGAIAVAGGFDHAMVLLDDGTVMSWGSNASGQLGYATLEETSLMPTAIPDLTGVVQLAAGSDASFALTEDGQVFGWGENDRGQLGLGSADDDPHETPTLVPDLSGVVQIAAANTTTFALLDDGTVVSWGRNHTGQAGTGLEGDDVLVPTQVLVAEGEPLSNIDNIAGDGFVGLALDDQGVVYAWGLGSLGQLGQGYLMGGERDLDDRLYASAVAVDDVDSDLFDIVEIEVGAGGPGLALGLEPNLFGWGWSFRGSLGLEGAINAWAYSAPLLVFAAD